MLYNIQIKKEVFYLITQNKILYTDFQSIEIYAQTRYLIYLCNRYKRYRISKDFFQVLLLFIIFCTLFQ